MTFRASAKAWGESALYFETNNAADLSESSGS